LISIETSCCQTHSEVGELSVLIARTQPDGVRIAGYNDSLDTPQYNFALST
jgi:hypothetical protein